MPDIDKLSAQVESLTAQLEDLVSREQIRNCIYRINRGMDRIDREVMASGFHPDAVVRWGTPDAVDLNSFLDTAMIMQSKTQRVQHLVGQILIDLHGDEAEVEAYEIGRHLTPMGEEMKDLIIASRYIDRFARRDGKWGIVHRSKVADWIRVMEGSDPLYDMVPSRGLRDDQDLSVQMFRTGAFRD
ncbi:nuclear transport factor 2 family protein [Croceicoccus bisphenolivorans]|uniref:nuclear transport factor 2 family protein n=1 Tax=Croceicoccus bisphenolivorans TaxID=1783232 RepID=UPI000A5F9498|nr:nuclear transport factor 2 family protein [Croceicoccus bisphenolivorans]